MSIRTWRHPTWRHTFLIDDMLWRTCTYANTSNVVETLQENIAVNFTHRKAYRNADYMIDVRSVKRCHSRNKTDLWPSGQQSVSWWFGIDDSSGVTLPRPSTQRQGQGSNLILLWQSQTRTKHFFWLIYTYRYISLDPVFPSLRRSAVFSAY